MPVVGRILLEDILDEFAVLKTLLESAPHG
jgi:hypothetical protein